MNQDLGTARSAGCLAARLARLFAPLLALLLVAAPASAEEPGPHTLSPAGLASVVSGTPYVRVTQDGNNNRAELVCVIDAPIDSVWEVIMDYERYASWFPDQLVSRVLSRSERSHVLEGETRVPILRNRTYQLRDQWRTIEVRGKTVYVDQWEYIPDSGNLNSTTGFWYVEPFGPNGSQTLVRMVVHADLGMWVPTAIINWGTRRMMPGIASGIQEQVIARGG